jgi:hypothetical protein
VVVDDSDRKLLQLTSEHKSMHANNTFFIPNFFTPTADCCQR